ncbi:sialate O-acetylesterase [Herbiconiux sp. YIM B11900]|uniref:sialate O-acetylesterase n=1 Tax=Herbiconiux sp. YIM B11900 TaxID=3404131 RepID=UPI003F83FC65
MVTWITESELSIADDITTAGAINADGSLSRTAVETRVDARLAGSATVVAAAAAAATTATAAAVPPAVNAAITQAGVPITVGGSGGAVLYDAELGLTFGDGTGTWLLSRADGGVPRYIAENLIGVVVLDSPVWAWALYYQDSGTVLMGVMKDGTRFGFGTASPRQARFFAIGGQSNAVGKADEANIYLDPPNSRVFMADATGKIVPAADPIISADSVARKGFVFEFGRLMAEKYPNDDIILCLYALGGTGFYHPDATPAQRWNPTAGGNLYNGWLNKIGLTLVQAAAKYQSVVIDGILWHQLEADRSHPYAEIVAMLDPLVDGVRGYLGDQTIPFIAGQPAREYIDTWTEKTGNTALIDLPRRKTRTAFAPSEYGWVGPDGIHFNRAGYDRLARSYVAAYSRAIRNVTGQSPEQVLRLGARRVGANVLVSWEAPIGRVESYSIDWNPSATATDATSGWVTTGVTQITALDVAATITAPVASPVGGAITVRVRAVNAAGTSLSNTYVV